MNELFDENEQVWVELELSHGEFHPHHYSIGYVWTIFDDDKLVCHDWNECRTNDCSCVKQERDEYEQLVHLNLILNE